MPQALGTHVYLELYNILKPRAVQNTVILNHLHGNVQSMLKVNMKDMIREKVIAHILVKVQCTDENVIVVVGSVIRYSGIL